MSRIPLPERGQPLDLAYIYELAKTINDLSDQLSPAVARYTTIDTVAAGKQSVRTSDTRIVGTYTEAENNTAISADSEGIFSVNFSDFKYVPIVTATPVLLGEANTESAKDVSIVITQITTNRVEGIVKFNTSGTARVGINILAVGIPV